MDASKYWAERNKLVDAVLAEQRPSSGFLPPGVPYPRASDAYYAACDALAEFDLVHGGAPVL